MGTGRSGALCRWVVGAAPPPGRVCALCGLLQRVETDGGEISAASIDHSGLGEVVQPSDVQGALRQIRSCWRSLNLIWFLLLYIEGHEENPGMDRYRASFLATLRYPSPHVF